MLCSWAARRREADRTGIAHITAWKGCYHHGGVEDGGCTRWWGLTGSATEGIPPPSSQRHATIKRLNWKSSTLLAHMAGILIEETIGVGISFTDGLIRKDAWDNGALWPLASSSSMHFDSNAPLAAPRFTHRSCRLTACRHLHGRQQPRQRESRGLAVGRPGGCDAGVGVRQHLQRPAGGHERQHRQLPVHADARARRD